MENEKSKKKRESTATIRKTCSRGTVTQRMMSFRLDSDLIEHLEQTANKGRLINDLLRKHFEQA